MDSYPQFHRAHSNAQLSNLNLNLLPNPNFLLESIVQDDIGQQAALSPGDAESSHSSYRDSPTPPATTHQQTAPQPYAPQLDSGWSPVGMPHSSSSPISPLYGQPIPNTLDFTFGDMPGHEPNGMVGVRHNSSENAVAHQGRMLAALDLPRSLRTWNVLDWIYSPWIGFYLCP